MGVSSYAPLLSWESPYFDEPRAHPFLRNGEGNGKIDGWYLNTGTTHHMTGQRDYFSDLASTVRGSIKFGDATAVEIKGARSVIFKAGEHQLLTGVYYIQALQN